MYVHIDKTKKVLTVITAYCYNGNGAVELYEFKCIYELYRKSSI